MVTYEQLDLFTPYDPDPPKVKVTEVYNDGMGTVVVEVEPEPQPEPDEAVEPDDAEVDAA